MRVDPEAVYLEVKTHALIFNFSSQEERYAPAAILHWKDGKKWQRRTFFGGTDTGNTLEEILGKIGAWIDQNGMEGALDQAMGREPETARAE